VLGWRSTLGQWKIIAMEGRAIPARKAPATGVRPLSTRLWSFNESALYGQFDENTRPKTKRDYRSKHVRFFAFRSRPHEYGAGRDERCDQIQGTPLEPFTRTVIDAFLGGRFRHDRLS